MARYDQIKIKNARLAKEIRHIEKGRLLHGFNCELEENEGILLVKFPGPASTIYEREKFDLKINLDDLYPCSPPKFQLVTPIYHPNIDKDGRICLNILNMPPEGGYSPTMTIESMLVSLQLLISNPNPYDPLRSDAASDYILNKAIFDEKVRQHIAMNRKNI